MTLAETLPRRSRVEADGAGARGQVEGACGGGGVREGQEAAVEGEVREEAARQRIWAACRRLLSGT